MKRYFSCTLLCILISYFIRAQENISSDFGQISTPFSYIRGVAISEKIFLFDRWVRAKLLTANNSVISNDSFLFNFDKLDRRLLLTTDFKTLYEIDNREFKAIMFYRYDSAYIFKHINYINEKDLFQVLVNNSNKYSLYKVTHSKLVNTRFSGITYVSPEGKPMDLYRDIAEYYIFFPNREYRKIFALKKTQIVRIFKLNPDKEIVDDYFRKIGDKDQYDERELIDMISYLNKEAS